MPYLSLPCKICALNLISASNSSSLFGPSKQPVEAVMIQ